MKNILLLFLVIAGVPGGRMCRSDENQKHLVLRMSRLQIRSLHSQTATHSVHQIYPIATTPSGLKGLLKISLDGWIGEFPVSIDNMSSGVVATQRPITLMMDEGNHTVEVCCGVVCEQENITIRFGEQRIVDFSEQLKKDCEFLEPVVRIVGYFMNGDQIAVNVEFINPTTQTLTMSAEISCGYSYIESRSNNRVGNSAQGQVFSTLNPGDRTIKMLNLNLASGYSYNFGAPIITRFDHNKL